LVFTVSTVLTAIPCPSIPVVVNASIVQNGSDINDLAIYKCCFGHIVSGVWPPTRHFSTQCTLSADGISTLWTETNTTCQGQFSILYL
jgi:hypothetical protein